MGHVILGASPNRARLARAGVGDSFDSHSHYFEIKNQPNYHEPVPCDLFCDTGGSTLIKLVQSLTKKFSRKSRNA